MVNARTAEQWAEIIQAKWQDSVTGIMETGLALDNAREELGATVFWKMVRDDLKFAHSTATKLQRIGTSAALMECSHGNILPAHWPTLYALACLTDEQMQSSRAAPRKPFSDVTVSPLCGPIGCFNEAPEPFQCRREVRR